MRRLIALIFITAACFACLTAGRPVASQTSSVFTRLDPEKIKQRQLITTLRERIRKGDPTRRDFWNDVKQLEALGPPEFKIAVKKYPGRTMIYTYKNVNGLAVADGDIVLGPFAAVQAEQASFRGDGPGNLAFANVNASRSSWWPDAFVPFEIASDLEQVAKDGIMDAINDYRRFTPVRFARRDGEGQFVRFIKEIEMFDLPSHTDSIGTNGGQVSIRLQTKPEGNLLSQADIAATARHEIGHVLGLFHEHNRSDRDSFVDIDWGCTDFRYILSGNYSIEWGSQNIGPYDFNSIMHYPSIDGEKGFFWEKKTPCFNMVKQVSKRAPGDDDGVIEETRFLSVHDINALHHMYGVFGPSGHTGDDYGSTVLVHDFDPSDQAHYPDLIVGAPEFNDGAGAVFLYKGTASGFVLWKILRDNDKGTLRFGASLAVGDFDGDEKDDLAVGAPNSTVKGHREAGKVVIFRINGNSVVFSTRVIEKPASAGFNEKGDHFGEALAAGMFLDPANSNEITKVDLAIGAPRARTVQGRVGRVWVWKIEPDDNASFTEVAIARPERFAQIGNALAVVKDHPAPALRPSDRLAISAPGITFGICATPRVYVTKPGNFNDVDVLSQHAAPDKFCPKQPRDEPLDTFPFVSANLRGRLASGDFNADRHADLVVNEPDNVYLYMSNELGQLELNRTLFNSEFGESLPESSFGAAMTTGDVNHDGLDDLILGAPSAWFRDLRNVGKFYVYRGCTRGTQSVEPQDPPVLLRPNPTPLTVNNTQGQGTCPGLSALFKADQVTFQNQDLISPATGLPLFPPFTESKEQDQFGVAVAILPPGTDRDLMLVIGSRRKAFGSNRRTGAVFLFKPSITPDLPSFRNSSALTSKIATRIERP